MVVTRKNNETNQQLVRRFNRIMQILPTLQIAKDKREFVKPITRSLRKAAAVRRNHIRAARNWY
jgi:ribosomal protein S21